MLKCQKIAVSPAIDTRTDPPPQDVVDLAKSVPAWRFKRRRPEKESD